MKKNISNQKREANYDLLRIVCAITIIACHVSATYKAAITDPDIFGKLYSEHLPTIIIYNTLSRFAVPCFMMLSGAFLVSNNNNIHFKNFYKKSYHSIVIPTIIFSILYFCYSEAIAALSVFVKGKDTSLIEPFTSLLSGNPFYHMWYMYTLIVVYIFIPVIIMVKNEIGEKNFAKVSWIYLIVSCISGWTSSFAIEWSISKAVCYIGFILTGYQLRRILMDRKNNILGIVCIFTGICLLLILSYIQYSHSIRGISEASETYSITGNFNPLVVLASLSIFAGFSMMNIQTEIFNSLSAKTFYIYLIHAAIWDTLVRIITKLDDKGIACTIIIPCGIIITFIATYICTILYIKIEKLFQKA